MDRAIVLSLQEYCVNREMHDWLLRRHDLSFAKCCFVLMESSSLLPQEQMKVA